MSETHYQVLQLTTKATADEIKQSYRRLAKEFHPDVNGGKANLDRIIQLNAAYEVLGDERKRREYDYLLQPAVAIPRQQQSSAHIPRRPRPVGHELDEELILWLNQVYQPINRTIGWIIKPLKTQIRELSADPFDDELMANFEAYVTECQKHLQKIDKIFHSMPNPSLLADIAANLYYTVNQVSDGVKELNFYIMNYDESYLHDGTEMFKIAAQLQKETNKRIKSFK
ncbi:DnaJ domain-containing protein [Chamaesiphon sp. VAR_48_metabat_135_sub]|uniref:J domain-containing protein n=1 Tax=Chamaesiphon sp. VAR_48_metabat_135_sub TaxID=2964699 RepID=UPI00286C1ACC|nr:DnaJ domain-containing protein [Chamaesiphon sp. VAR_48_metabat_135_sub]